jgi:uncharacterized metal-binding protein
MNQIPSPAAAPAAAAKLIFACSGAADVGALSDQAARRLTREGAGAMFCLAGLGGRVGAIMERTAAAARILAIDGCPTGCAAKCLEQAGFTGFLRLQLADLGMAKGQSPLTEERLGQVCAAAAAMLA